MKTIVLIVMLATVCLGGCGGGSTGPETPADALQEIIRLYEKRDFDTLIRTRYAEIAKAENEDQVRMLVERFTERYADEARLKQATALYQSLLSSSPEMSDDGATAVFRLEGGFVKLTRMPDGKWGFHL